MKNKNNKTSVATEELPTNKSINVRLPDNNLYKQSRYIVAIGFYLDSPELMGPVTEYIEGEKYTFELYDPKKQVLYKILDHLSDEYRKYAQHPSKPVLIANVENFACSRVDDLTSYEFVISFGEFLKTYITNLESTYLYYEEKLWRFQEELADGTTHWRSIVPSALDQYHWHARDVDEDEEEWLEEENRKLNENGDEEEDDEDDE